MFGFGKEKPTTTFESPDKEKQTAEKMEKQTQLGTEIFDKLKATIDERAKSEEAADEKGPNLVLGKLENNGGKYSIMLYVKDNFGTHFLRGFDVNLGQEAEELGVQTGPYDQTQYYGLDQMDEFMERIKKEALEAK